MNKVILMGRLTRDPEIRYTSGQNPMAVARYTIAVDRRYQKNGDENTADFIPCIAFGKQGEFVEKYLSKGIKVCIVGRIQTGSYTNNEGKKVYTTDVVVEEHEFAESKSSSQSQQGNVSETTGHQTDSNQYKTDENGFMNIPDGIDEDLPFN